MHTSARFLSLIFGRFWLHLLLLLLFLSFRSCFCFSLAYVFGKSATIVVVAVVVVVCDLQGVSIALAKIFAWLAGVTVLCVSSVPQDAFLLLHVHASICRRTMIMNTGCTCTSEHLHLIKTFICSTVLQPSGLLFMPGVLLFSQHLQHHDHDDQFEQHPCPILSSFVCHAKYIQETSDSRRQIFTFIIFHDYLLVALVSICALFYCCD